MSVQRLHLGNRKRGRSVGVFVLGDHVLLPVGGGLLELLCLRLGNRYRYRARGVDRGLLLLGRLLGCLLCCLLLWVAASRASSVAIGSARVCLSVCAACGEGGREGEDCQLN